MSQTTAEAIALLKSMPRRELLEACLALEVLPGRPLSKHGRRQRRTIQRWRRICEKQAAEIDAFRMVAQAVVDEASEDNVCALAALATPKP